MLICPKPKIFDVDIYGLAAGIAILALAWILIIRPLNDKFQKRTHDELQFRQDTQSAQAQLEQLENLIQRRRLLADRLSHTPNPLCENAQMPEIVRRLGVLARTAQLQLNEINPGAPEITPHYRKNILTLSLSGSFPQLNDLLTRFARELPYARIDSLEVAVPKDSGRKDCNILMNLHVFARN